MRESFITNVAAHLATEDPLDLVYVSHVDDDHIAGILQLLDNAMAWKVYQHHRNNGDNGVRPPQVPLVPAIKRIWHNAFHDQIGDNAGDVADLLAAMVPYLASTDDDDLQRAAVESQALIYSNAQAIKVSQRLRREQLNIPLNQNDKLMMVRGGQNAFAVGDLSLHVIAPFAEDVDNFRDQWNKWLRANKDTVKKLRAQAKADAARLEEDVQELTGPLALDVKELGDRKAVTPPNLASIMLFVTEGEKKALLTGDGHADDVLRGLKHIGALNNDGTLHVDILKVQHHGSEHNMTAEFARRITADHYVFCGNGFSGNPEPIVLDAIFEARTKHGAGPHEQFKFWFNSSKEVEPGKPDRAKHMAALERQATRLRDRDTRLTASFLKHGDYFDLAVE